MKTKIFEITCPGCQSTWAIQAPALVNGELEKGIKQKILQEAFFNRKCSNCGNIIKFYYPFVYQDPKHKVLITIDIDDVQMDDYRLYAVKNEPELIELIKILDDDEMLEHINLIKEKLVYKYCYYNGKDKEYYFFETDKGLIAIQRKQV